ncbi:uncharacterized protein LOC131691699 [Topomyia yanbarensis]|uniref:uncharacterized protein LOC131691699 n=1 Tax=Topomyia yanbarensis TaxID=2498891 RepID=UPI00273AEC3C|nr:uncharacterized protein LOC131691699 [Topomyia yanbarensis]
MKKNAIMNCPRTPAPMRNASFLMSAAAILETPTLLKKPASSTSVKPTPSCASSSTVQPPSAASTAAMQFLMFNQMQATGSGSPFQQSMLNRTNMGSNTSGFNFTIPSVPDSTTTVTTRIIENLQFSSNENSYKRKLDGSAQNKPLKRVAFEPLPLKPNITRRQQRTLPAIGPAKQSAKPPNESGKPDPKKLCVITGSVEHVTKLTKYTVEVSPLVEVYANVLNIKTGGYECEKILLLRNKTGPVMQGVFYEIDFRMTVLSVGDLVRCVGRLTNGSRLQILKITPATAEEERMAQRLQTVCGFTAAVKR